LADLWPGFAQTLIATIAVGSLYALIALGYTLVFGVLKFINFAHSDIFVLGAWTSFTSATVILTAMNVDAENAPWWVGVCVLLLAICVCSTTGYCIERFAYRPLRKAPRLNVLITAIGVSLLLQNIGQLSGVTVASKDGKSLATVPFGATPARMPSLLPDAVLNTTTVASGSLAASSKRGQVQFDQDLTIDPARSYTLIIERKDSRESRTDSLAIRIPEGFDGKLPKGQEIATTPARSPAQLAGATFTLVRQPTVPIRLIDVLIVVSSLVLMAGLQILVFKTKLGSAMRALSFNTETAALMGINVNLVISFTFIVGTALAASASFLYPMKYAGLNQPASGIWVLLGLKAFVAAVVGGIGNVRGAVLGGFLIAGIEFFGSKYISTELKDVYVFGLLILVLLIRPNGLLGKSVREKV